MPGARPVRPAARLPAGDVAERGGPPRRARRRARRLYPLRISWPGILADDEGHPEDIVGRVREALAVIWPRRGHRGRGLRHPGVKALRDYFRKPAGFYDDHLKRYSKSRRQAPIYWPLSTPTGELYPVALLPPPHRPDALHRGQRFRRAQAGPCQRGAARLRGKARRSTAEEKELERLSDLALELYAFRQELLRLAPLWKPDLNDGVQITAAPLWRLFHKPVAEAAQGDVGKAGRRRVRLGAPGLPPLARPRAREMLPRQVVGHRPRARRTVTKEPDEPGEGRKTGGKKK